MIALLLAIALTTSQPTATRVEVVEVNEFHRDQQTVMVQVLLRRWLRLANGSSHYVEDWRLVKGEPITRWRHGRRYIDVMTSDGVLTFESKSIRWTRTAYDPELRERAK